MSTFHGIIVYEISDNGNLLTGRYTATPDKKTQPEYGISGEVARKKKFDDKGVDGTYICDFMETKPDPDIVIHCTIEIKKVEGVYEFEWSSKEDGSLFVGLGMEVDDRHIAVSYTYAE